jgi:hypothetical protein
VIFDTIVQTLAQLGLRFFVFFWYNKRVSDLGREREREGEVSTE